MAAAVIPEREHFLPPSVSLSAENSPWPFANAFRTRGAAEIGDLASLGVRITGKPWPELVERAMVVPIHTTADSLAGLFVAGVGPRRPWDAQYRTFFEVVARHIGSDISEAKAYEEERRRAEALAQIDRAKTVFFSNASHEFRTPLTLILGPLRDMLAQANGTVTIQSDELDLVYRNSLRLLKLVNALLDFSQTKRTVSALSTSQRICRLSRPNSRAFFGPRSRPQV